MSLDLKRQILCDTSRIVFESSLKNLCMNVLMEQFRSNEDFAAYWRGRLINLPSSLRRAMLKKMELVGVEKRDWEEMEKASETALALMCSQIPTFNFECIELSGDPVFRRKQGKQQQVINKTYKLLAERHSESLQKLVHLYKPAIRLTNRHCDREKIVPSATRRFSFVLRLKNLRFLHLTEYSINQQQFKSLCQSLVNLEHLSCNFFDATEKHVSTALKNLTKLEEFEFSVSDLCAIYQPSMLCSYLLDRFPKLKVIGPRVNRLCQESETRIRHESHSLKNIKSWKEPSQLEHLSINQELTSEQAEMVPNVKALRVTTKNGSFKHGFGYAFWKLKKLKSLTVEGEHYWGYLRSLFSEVGPCLEGATFENTELLNKGTHCIDEFLSFCPNLKTLNATFIPDEAYFVNFEHLTKICIDGSSSLYSGDCLCLIFSPPKLEVVELWNVDIEVEDLQDAVDTMSAGIVSCSRKLREIRGSIFYYEFKETTVQADGVVSQLWDQFFQLVCIHSPELKVFDFRRGTTDLIGWLAKTMHKRSMTDV